MQRVGAGEEGASFRWKNLVWHLNYYLRKACAVSEKQERSLRKALLPFNLSTQMPGRALRVHLLARRLLHLRSHRDGEVSINIQRQRPSNNVPEKRCHRQRREEDDQVWREQNHLLLKYTKRSFIRDILTAYLYML